MRRRVQANGAVVPEHWQAEVENTVRIGEIRGMLTREDVSKFIEVIRAQQIEVDRQPVPQTFGELLPLSRQHRITVYDAAYVELAKRRGLQLATLDEGMLRAARALGVEVL